MEEQGSPDNAPKHCNRSVSVGSGKWDALDDLLPAKGINAEEHHHRTIAQHESNAHELETGGELTHHPTQGH